MFTFSKSLIRSPLILTNSLIDTRKSETKSVFCHKIVTFHDKDLQFSDFFSEDCDFL